MKLGGAISIAMMMVGTSANGSVLIARNPATTKLFDNGVEIYYRALTGSEPTVANVYAVFAIGTDNSEVMEIMTLRDTVREITERPGMYVPPVKDGIWQQKVRLAEKIVDSRHRDPTRVMRMYWKLLKTGLYDAKLVEPMKQALVHVYGPDMCGPDMCIAINKIEGILRERGRELDNLDGLTDLAAASALIAYTMETNSEALGEYAKVAEEIAAVRNISREATYAKKEALETEQQARITELDRLMRRK
ncbi:MAG: hypothetical protein LBD43_02805 [Holosporales bacterium]|jgi:hypothetical protein|nr:hypothetical protein [Holosporales bacterium]